MSAEKVIHTLLAAASPVTAIVAARIYPGELPQNTAMPALGISHISGHEHPALSAAGAFVLMQSRVEITILAKDYPTVKTLLAAVRAACNYQRGVISGVTVISVMRDTVGPDLRDSDLTIFSQTIDFMVTWQDPNP